MWARPESFGEGKLPAHVRTACAKKFFNVCGSAPS